MPSHDSRVALVTGASRGLGVYMAKALAARGMRLALAARSEAGLEAVRKDLTALGADVVCIPADLSDPSSVDRLARATEQRLGPVDVLVNNAGIEVTGLFEKVSPDELHAIVATNLTVPMLLAQRVLAGMLERDRGHIVNVASLAGLAAMPFGECYSATKHGLVGFTRALRTSLEARGSSVRASALCPGFVAESGMYADSEKTLGMKAPALLGTCRPQAVAAALLEALDRNAPEIVVNAVPMRPALAIGALFPRYAPWLSRVSGLNAMMLKVARARQSAAR